MANMLYVFANGKRIRALSDKACPTCDNLFKPRTSKNKFCSRKCYWTAKKGVKSKVVYTDELRQKLAVSKWGSNNPMKRREVVEKKMSNTPSVKGDKHPNWRGGVEMSRNYRLIYAPNHPYAHKGKVREHRLVMEKKLGRHLLPDEIVHHINHEYTDNRIENLMLTTRSEHVKIHPPK